MMIDSEMLFHCYHNEMSVLCGSEREKVKSYRQKISKWQGEVSERLQALSRRAGNISY